MSQSLTLPVSGLMTDPGPFTAAPEGGLVEAQNVVVMRPGVIEPRQGNLWIVDSTLKAGGYSAHAMYSDPADLAFVWALVGSTWIIRRNPATITGPSTFTRGKIRVCPTGGRALFTSDDGVCTLPSQTASPAQGSTTVAYRAGLPQPYTPTLTFSAASGTIPDNSRIRYRFTLRRRLADGTLVESPPSPPVDAVIAAAGPGPGSWIIAGPVTTDPYQAWHTPLYATNPFGDLMAGDQLCVWRTNAAATASTDPGDELRLRVVLPFNTTYGGFVDPKDPTAPLPFIYGAPTFTGGAALYTNATQEGILLSNYRPEYARDIALYNGMTFYAGARTAPRLDVASSTGGVSRQQELQSINLAATVGITLGSPTITGVGAADLEGLSVGQVIQTPGVSPIAAGAFPAATQIVSINAGAGTLTMSANALATNAAIFLTAWDWVEILLGTTRLRMYKMAPAFVGTFGDATNTVFDGLLTASAGATVGTAEASWNGQLAYPAAVGWEIWRTVQLRISGDPLNSGGAIWSWFFTAPAPAGTYFTFLSSKPLAWDRYVDSVTGVRSLIEGSVAELRWSKVNEPEHCPLPYRTTVGDAAYAIRRIIPARNSLLILKDDGLYQCFGQTPDALSFELLDRTVTLPAPATYDEQCKWVDRFDDRVVAMTTRGPMVLSDAGGEVIGAPILESLRRAFTASFGALDDALRTMTIDVTGRRVGFIWNVSGTAVGYMVDMETGTWTYWTWRRPIGASATRSSPSPVTAALGIPISPLILAGGYQAGIPYSDRTMLDDASVTVTTMPRTYEDVFTATCTVNTVTGAGPYEVTIAAGSEWTPTVGDLIIQTGVAYEVTSVTSATVFGVATSGLVAGAATWREGYPMRVVWLARAEGNPASEKHWFSAVFPFELTEAVNTMKSVFAGYRNPTTVTENAFETTSNGASPWPLVPLYKRVNVPSAIARDWAVKVGFSLVRAGTWFSTAGLSVQFAPIAPDKAAR